MADTDITEEQRIERIITVYLETAGVQDVAAGLKKVTASFKDVRSALAALNEKNINLNKIMNDQAKAYVRTEKAAANTLKRTQKNVSKTIKSFINLGGAVSEISGGLKQLAGLSGFGNMVNEAVKFDKSLLELSASTNRLGIGITQLENRLSAIARSTSLTRQETMSLFVEFNKSFKFVTLENFEGLLKRIEKMVGSNKDAIQGYASEVGSLTQSYNGLAQQIINLEGAGSEADKARIAARLQILYLSDKIGEKEYRNLIAIVKGNQQISDEDKKSQEASEKRIKTMQAFKIQIEDVALGLGKTILPLLEKVSDFLKILTNDGKDWGAAMVAGISAMAGIQLGGGILSAVGGKAAGLAMSGASSGAGLLAKGARKGLKASPGIISALFKDLKTPVLALQHGFLNLKDGLGEIVHKLGGFKGALGKAGAVVAVAAAGWAAGTAIYNKWVEPKLEEKGMGLYDKVMGNDKKSTRTSRAVGWLAGLGKKKGRQLTSEQKKEYDERRSRKRAGGDAKEMKSKKQAKAVAKAAEIKASEDKKAQELNEQMLVSMQQVNKYAEAVNKLRKSEEGLLDTEIERMKLTGDINTASLQSSKGKIFKTIDAEVDALKEYVQAMRGLQGAQASGEGRGKTVKEFAEMKGWSMDVVQALGMQETTMIDIVDAQSKISDAEQKINNKTKERFRTLEAINAVYDTQIKQSSLIADEAGLLVQIADSYAIGVGASAQMRMREYDALEGQISQMDRQLQNWKNALASATEDDARLELTNRIQEGENQILQVQLKQAGITKSLRDGWVEAIEAMNTGAGTFSKIILDQNKGTAQSLRLAGQEAIISAKSGSLRGGYRTSERFSTLQGQAGQGLISGAQGKRNFAYRTTMGSLTGSEAEGVQWMARGRATRDMASRNRLARRGGGAAVAFGASPHYEGQTAGLQGSANLAMNNSAGAINVNVSLSSDASRTGDEIVRVVVPQLQRIFSQISSGVLDGVKFRR